MKVAVQGCCHGELDIVYQVLKMAEERTGVKIDLLICCGDFQAVRDCGDLNCMAVPPKYRHMQTFYKYYSGEKTAPMLTIFIGGNHEASNHLWELGFGGWVAPNMYYLGNAGVVRYGGLRIAGISGIYNESHYRLNHFETPPYNQKSIRSTYHTRLCDIFKMKQLTGPMDIMLSHDWPLGIYHHGEVYLLLRLKPFFAEEVNTNTLGNPAAMELLKQHKPTYWFSGHLHVKFSALYNHTLNAPPPDSAQKPKPVPLFGSTDQAPETQGGEEKGEEKAADPDKEATGGAESKSVVAGGEGVATEGSSDVNVEGAGKEEAVVDGQGTDATVSVTGGATEEGVGEETGSSVDQPPDAVSGDKSEGEGAKPEGDQQTTDTEDQPPPVYTRFLALDKPMPRKRFLQILDFPTGDDVELETPYQLEYDREWLAILKSTEPLMRYSNSPWLPPHKMTDSRLDFTPTEEEFSDVEQRFAVDGCGKRLVIPQNFAQILPPYCEGAVMDFNAAPKVQENPQTAEFCEKLGIENPFKPKPSPTPAAVEPPLTSAPANPDEISVGEDVDSPPAKSPAEPDGFKGSLGEGLLEWEVDSQKTNRQPMHLPPPSSDPTPMEQSHDTAAESGDVAEEVETKAGVKRALPTSPQAGGESPAHPGAGSAGVGGGPEIKRRNVAVYGENTETQEEA